MKNLVESWSNGNDLPLVHKALGGRLDSVGIYEGALALFPPANKSGMNHQ